MVYEPIQDPQQLDETISYLQAQADGLHGMYESGSNFIFKTDQGDIYDAKFLVGTLLAQLTNTQVIID